MTDKLERLKEIHKEMQETFNLESDFILKKAIKDLKDKDYTSKPEIDRRGPQINESYEALEEEANLLKALAHPVRLVIVKGLMSEEGCNVSEMQQCLNIPQSTLSQHLAKLREANILNSERNGLERNYYVVNEKVKNIIRELSDFKKIEK